MKRLTTLFVLLCTTVLLCSSCFCYASSSDSSRKVERKGNLESFKGIKVSMGIEVVLIPGSKESYRLEASEKVADFVELEVDDEILKIRFDRREMRKIRRVANTVKVYLTYKELSSISVGSAAEVESEYPVKSEDLTLDVSSGAELDLDVVCKQINLNVSSGADASVNGTTDLLIAVCSSGADIDADDLKAKDVIANSSSGAGIDVWATETIKANASSGANVRYKGNPEVLHRTTSSGGSVRAIN